MTDWRSLALGARRIPEDPAQDPVAGFLGRALGLDQPSLLDRMVAQGGRQRERFERGERGPAPPGSADAMEGLDLASNFNFTGTFGGLKAKTADMGMYDMAQAFDKGGVSPRAIWEQTGWFKGPGGKWRFEIDDSQSKAILSPDAMLARNSNQPVLRTETFSHPEMEAAYPDQPKVFYDRRMPTGIYGTYEQGRPGKITVNRDIATPRIINGKLVDVDERSAQLHEGQHFVQYQEGFPRGGSPEEFAAEQLKYRDTLQSFEELAKLRRELMMQGDEVNPNTIWREARKVGYPAELMRDLAKQYPDTDSLMAQLEDFRQKVVEFDPFNRYERLAGEAEARAVQARMNLTPEQRRARFPLDDYEAVIGGRPVSDLIIKY